MRYSTRERVGMWLQGVPALRWLVLGHSHWHQGVRIYRNNISGHYVREDNL